MVGEALLGPEPGRGPGRPPHPPVLGRPMTMISNSDYKSNDTTNYWSYSKYGKSLREHINLTCLMCSSKCLTIFHEMMLHYAFRSKRIVNNGYRTEYFNLSHKDMYVLCDYLSAMEEVASFFLDKHSFTKVLRESLEHEPHEQGQRRVWF